jgi:hypothetical protein
MTYTVLGFRSGFLEIARLHSDLLARKTVLRSLPVHERVMRGYAVRPDGFFYLERRFGKGFQNFLLLDDVAIEACQAFKIPCGERVGEIELAEMGSLAIRLFAWEYWAEPAAGFNRIPPREEIFI